ncbi:MAG: DnaJ domain-containing protein, partial [Deltaproteobacteria bacterium]|nr:DnaJ domain-containing protein [Deltaproteobacteria bacterium]
MQMQTGQQGNPPLSVLIVEDEGGGARLLASLCDELKLASQTVRSGTEALRLIDNDPSIGCAVIDLVLAESDGFTVAQGIRVKRPNVPLLVVSGVYKTLPAEFQNRVNPEVFLPKPFEPSRVRAELSRLCNVGPAKAVEGDLAQKPAAQLYVELLRGKLSGCLTLTREAMVRKLHFQGGLIRYAQSNVKNEAAGQAQVNSGMIKQASFDRAVALARQQKIALHEALAAARVLTLDQLKVALKQQTTEVAIGGLEWADGKHVFEVMTPDVINALPDARTSPVSVVSEWAKRVNPGTARTWLEAHAQDRMARTPELDKEMFALKANWPGEAVTPLIAPNKSIGEVLARVKEPELPLFHALCMSGLVVLSKGASAVAGGVHPAAGKSAADEDKGKVFSAKEHEVRRMLFGERERLKEATHYEILGVEPTATPEQIKAAFLAAARRVHSDAFSGLELGSARRAGEELFQKVNEANAVLSSAKDRAEYDVFLDRKAKGLPTDVAAILKAEALFQKGETFYKVGKYEDAEGLFREAI